MKNNKKGFTLAELLVVVGIIAVLIAIAIPVFSGQVEKAREAVDAANIRSAYAELMTEKLTGTPANKAVELTQTTKGWSQTFEWPKNLSMPEDTAYVDGTKFAILSINTAEDGVSVTYSATDTTKTS